LSWDAVVERDIAALKAAGLAVGILRTHEGLACKNLKCVHRETFAVGSTLDARGETLSPAKLVDQEQPFKGETSMVKLFATEIAVEAAMLAIQVRGGHGAFDEFDVSGVLGEAKVLTFVEGPAKYNALLLHGTL
jgi:alkylation response protein AidB-like acyl-CoA dehydrogenase